MSLLLFLSLYLLLLYCSILQLTSDRSLQQCFALLKAKHLFVCKFLPFHLCLLLFNLFQINRFERASFQFTSPFFLFLFVSRQPNTWLFRFSFLFTVFAFVCQNVDLIRVLIPVSCCFLLLFYFLNYRQPNELHIFLFIYLLLFCSFHLDLNVIGSSSILKLSIHDDFVFLLGICPVLVLFLTPPMGNLTECVVTPIVYFELVLCSVFGCREN